ncbi:ribosomal-protein-alanine N-acetyltransferase [Pullulanibacillus pueri]|uniref:Putative ribosomal-protein-alanine acetyltransferase n=1 Tax=Pullulanibacillus pueri TaxID=1437324 RepID=A0A8J3ELU3_9BACL|nr:GNAT family protein [Pullulanibacillus pueri]MBM7681270.1 ribosomal-protein-alanine N-acetyltransferase [Pullulanibacillus pueri]GGH77807.1 putative ribosomal-protein-alanine acetyltransferase [Pullulanibacillus pueri]
MTTLMGDRIYVKLVEEADAEVLLALELKNKDFFQLYTGSRKDDFYTLEGQLERIKTNKSSAEADQGYFFVIYLRESEQLIGEITLFEVARGNLQSCWIGYFLDQEQNGKGYMTEAVRLVVDYAFQTLRLHRIEAGVMPHNIGSAKVLLKAGFQKEGLSRENVKINGKWEDHQLFAIINEDDVDE